MKIARWVSFVFMLMSGAAVLLRFAILWVMNGFTFNFRKAGSIGIIGGANGPTAIFVSGNEAPDFMPGIFVLALVAWIILRFKTKKK